MHECGVAHSDIKADNDNVIIHRNPSSQDSNVVLLDYSLCVTTFRISSMQAHIALEDMAR
jgi:serine/threonine protein kinase